MAAAASCGRRYESNIMRGVRGRGGLVGRLHGNINYTREPCDGTLRPKDILQGEKEKSPSMTERALQVWQARGGK